MRVVGYIREASADGELAFAQSEKIRRWITDNGHQLVAICQDVSTPGHPAGREGLRSLVGIISAGRVDAVVVPSLATMSPDKASQEVIMWNLRSHNVTVLSTDLDDIAQLKDLPIESVRLIVRDVLSKVSRFDEILRLRVAEEPQPEIIRIDDTPGVVIELIPPNHSDGSRAGRVTPARQAQPT